MTDYEKPSAAPPLPDAQAPQAASLVLRGTPVAPGLAMGLAGRKDHDLARISQPRVPRERIEHELNRFHRSLR